MGREPLSKAADCRRRFTHLQASAVPLKGRLQLRAPPFLQRPHPSQQPPQGDNYKARGLYR